MPTCDNNSQVCKAGGLPAVHEAADVSEDSLVQLVAMP